MSKIEVDAIDKQSGSTLTLGGSGTAVTLGTGATQSGFGRTGAVDWQTTPKTGNFTAANGEGYFINTTSGAVTMTMPAGSAGAIVSIQDYNKTFDTNALTITPASGERINGGTVDGALGVVTEGQGLTFVYVDATVGWKTVHENEFTQGGSSFIIATGGTITTCGNDKIHTFTGPGTFTVCTAAGCASNNLVSYLVVAGGGGAGNNRGGGGGAGGFREVVSPSSPYTGSPLNGYPSSPNRVTVTATAFPITVGGGGTGVPGPASETTIAGKGNNSSGLGITSTGGGGGGSRDSGHLQPAPAVPSASGGSGGGYGSSGPSGASPTSSPNGGLGNTPPVSPAQGSNGGSNGRGSGYSGGTGGGGATVQGSPQNINVPSVPGSTYGRNRGAAIPSGAGGLGGDGGQGATTSITGSAVGYAGGGAGGGSCNPGTWSPNDSLGGTGGMFGNPATGTTPLFGGGPGGNAGTGGNPGTTNRGGGGGGGGCGGNAGANGGSGIVIIRYKFQ